MVKYVFIFIHTCINLLLLTLVAILMTLHYDLFWLSFNMILFSNGIFQKLDRCTGNMLVIWY